MASVVRRCGHVGDDRRLTCGPADETIVALSSGPAPSAVAVIRVSGPDAFTVATRLCGSLPPLREARTRVLRDADGQRIDRALVIRFAPPASATGEPVVELHCHGSRAVIAAVQAALVAGGGARQAEPGEFTRRALLNGKLDLTAVEGLSALLAAETEQQRRAALRMAEGEVRAAVERWRAKVVGLAARVEAIIEFQEEDERAVSPDDPSGDMLAVAAELRAAAATPAVERLYDGYRVVIAGPPNSGKSSLLNALVGRAAAIVTPIAGTTRDCIEVPVQREGRAYLLTDTAGLHHTTDIVEALGIERATQAVTEADLLLWTGDAPPDPPTTWRWLWTRADLSEREPIPRECHWHGSVHEPAAISRLWALITEAAELHLPGGTDVLYTCRQRSALAAAAEEMESAAVHADVVVRAELLRGANRTLSAITGAEATDKMLEALFATFCIGK